MKKFILFIVCFISINANAQRLVRNEVNGFSGDTIVESTYRRLFSINMRQNFVRVIYNLSYRIRRYNSDYTMDVNIVLNNEVEYDSSSSISFQLKNGEVLTFPINNPGKATPMQPAGWIFNTSFPLNDEDLQKFKKYSVKFVRIVYKEGEYSREIKKNFSKSMKRCVKKIVNKFRYHKNF